MYSVLFAMGVIMRVLVSLLLLLMLVPGSVLAQGELPPEEIERIAQSVVLILNVQNDEIVSSGSGTIVSSTGLIYTNRHVIEDAQDLYILLLDDINEQPEPRYRARVIVAFDDADFAILQIDRNAAGNTVIPTALNLPFIQPTDVMANRGERLYIFGYPSIGDGYLVLTQGTITTVRNGDIGDQRMVVWYQTDAEISPGNSGGLAVTASGELLGIPTSVRSEDRTMGRLGGILPFSAVTALAEIGPSVTSGQPDSDRSGAASQGLQIDITDIEYNAEQDGENGIRIYTTLRADGYQDVPLRIAVFFYWPDDQPVIANEDAPDSVKTPSGHLTIQDVIVPSTDAAEWGEITFWLPNIGLPRGLTGQQEMLVIADMAVDGEAFVAPSVPRTLVINYPDEEETTTVTGTGVSASCDGLVVNNGVEIVVRQMRPGFSYTATVVGLGEFDPVLIVRETVNPDACIASDDADGAANYSVNLPTSGQVSAGTLSSQLDFRHTNASMTDISLIVSDYNGNAGEFVLVLEGMAVTREDNAGDPFSVLVNPAVINSEAGLTVYMLGAETQLDPKFYLLDGNYDQWVDSDGNEIFCDDGGDAAYCWGASSSLEGSLVRRGSRATINADSRDAMMSLLLGGLSPQPLTFLMSSYDRETTGQYVIVFHVGLN